MSKKSKVNRYKGLKFNYKIDGRDEALSDKFLTIIDFLNAKFPINGNPLSPTDNTEIFNITWNGHVANINKEVKTISDLREILLRECLITKNNISISEPCKSRNSLQEYERKSIHSIDEIRKLTKDVLFEKYKQNAKVELDGDMIKGNSKRYQLFFTKGMKCVSCGIEGKYFAKEKNEKDISYHLNLYGIDDNGNEILITKDHIIPTSKGGKNKLENFQTMCVYCNQEKGNKVYIR